MKTINQRTLRNDNAAVIRDVEGGESFVVTRRGVPVATLQPHGRHSGPRVARPATRRFEDATFTLVKRTMTVQDVLDDLRGER
ncbi:MAG: hypothetical protein FWD59_04085 [Micrococcales bacterium]|nr:hypothetical protein [Micrococcales bacterium]